MPFRLGPWEIGLILIVVILIFGIGKLPQVGNAIGKSIREFRKSSSGEETEETEPEAVAKTVKKTTRAPRKAK